MLTYADGTALSRSLGTSPESDAWLAWSATHAPDLVTSPLGLTELRRTAAGLGAAARAAAHDVADSVTVLRFSDQALRAAVMAGAVVDSFRAIHLGIAASHPDVERMATYDPLLARMAAIYGLDVVSPGLADGWWDP